MPLTKALTAFGAGEISPALWAHVDLGKYQVGCATLRNCFVSVRGGAYSRPGSKFCGQTRQAAAAASTPPRLIPFQFSTSQGYVLELGDDYARFIANGAYLTETPIAVTAATKANPCVLAAPGHDYANGDWVAAAGFGGMTELNGQTLVVANVGATTFSLADTFGNPINSLGFPAYTGGGTVARIYTIATPYAAIDLPYLKWTQSADLMSLTLVNATDATEYAPADLERFAANDWALVGTTFASSIGAPSGVTAVPSTTVATLASVDNAPAAQYAYVVTAIDAATGDESVASDVAYTPADDSTGSVDISITAGSVLVSWSPVAGAAGYNVYRAPAAPWDTGSSGAAAPATVPIGSQFGFAGSTSGTQWTDSNVVPDYSTVPPTHQNPFAPGQIVGITVTDGGSGYDQETTTATVVSATGSGAVLLPVVVGGVIVAVIIVNAGANYRATDTISFSGQAAGSGASASYTVSPTDGAIVAITLDSGGSGYSDPTVTPAAGGTGAVLGAILQGGVISAIYMTNSGEGYSAGDFTITDAAPGPGSGATAALTVGPSSGNYPGVVSYFQQRRTYAQSLNNPDTLWGSQTGSYTNMDAADPPIDSDAITSNPWAQQVNGIQWLANMPTGLLVGTGLDVWLLEGSGGPYTPVTPSSEDAIAQEANGFSPTVPPIKINYQLLFVQALGYIVRALNYNYFTNTYAGEDLTVLANHLFEGHQVLQWAWAREPFKIVWCVRDDGVLLSLTYLKEQEVIAWARHDTNGQVVSIAVASEPPVDAVYIVVKRFIPGKNAYGYYVERLDNRLWNNAEQCWCVDAGLALPLPTPDAALTPAAATGNGVVFVAAAAVFDGVATGAVGQVIRVGGGKATVTQYLSPTQVVADITLAITALTPNDPNNRPLPAAAGAWSIATPATGVSGLNHLEGMTVTGLADGQVIPPTVVTNGAIALPGPATAVVVGLGFQAQIQSLPMEIQGPSSIQGKRKKIPGITVRLEASRGVKLGVDQVNASEVENYATTAWGVRPYGKMIELKQSQAQLGPGNYLPLFTGDLFAPVDSDWNKPGWSAAPGMVAAQQDYPLPMNVLGFFPDVTVGDSHNKGDAG